MRDDKDLHLFRLPSLLFILIRKKIKYLETVVAVFSAQRSRRPGVRRGPGVRKASDDDGYARLLVALHELLQRQLLRDIKLPAIMVS